MHWQYHRHFSRVQDEPCPSIRPMCSLMPISETPLRPVLNAHRRKYWFRHWDFLTSLQIMKVSSYPTPDFCSILGWAGIWGHFSRVQHQDTFQHRWVPYICTLKNKEIAKTLSKKRTTILTYYKKKNSAAVLLAVIGLKHFTWVRLQHKLE